MDKNEKLHKADKFFKEGKFGEAEFIYKELLKEFPDDNTILTLYGFLAIKSNDFSKACRLLKKSYNIKKDARTLKGLAFAYQYSKNTDDAIETFAELIELEPNYNNYKVLTSILADKYCIDAVKYGKLTKKYIHEAYKKFPLDTEIMINYATYIFHTGNFNEAEKICKNCIKMNPKFARAWELMGIIYEGIYCDEDNAQVCHKKSIEYGLNKTGYYNLGISYTKSGDLQKAEDAFTKALEFTPENSAIINKARAENYLKHRNFEKGYKLFIKNSDSKFFNKLDYLWDGKNYKDKTLLVLVDMCYGDHIFFARYLPYLKNKFANIYVQTFDALKKIFQENFNGINFIGNNEVPEHDYYVPLSHLPYYLNMDFNNIPYSQGYLNSNNAQITSDKLKIGLCWGAGNRDIRSTIHRNINIKEFENLLNKDYEFYSFQLDASVDFSKYNLIDLSPKINDFYDTARYLKSMDILISVDTSVPNLAGALGVKTFLLLPYYSDWRWFDNTETTEWYDSINIYKQTEKHSWQNEINRISIDLKKL